MNNFKNSTNKNGKIVLDKLLEFPNSDRKQIKDSPIMVESLKQQEINFIKYKIESCYYFDDEVIDKIVELLFNKFC